VPHIAYHANYGAPWTSRRSESSHLDTLADGVFAAPYTPGERFVDQYHWHSIRAIVFAECTPTQKRYPHALQISEADAVPVRRGIILGIGRVLALRMDAVAILIATER
jgi:hypothetical protein